MLNVANLSYILKYKRFTMNILRLHIFVALFIFFIFILNIFLEYKIEIKNNFKTISLKEQNSSIIANDVTITHFLNKQEKITVRSLTMDRKNDNVNVLNDCFITTPHLRGKIYRGNTDLIEIDEHRNYFSIPKRVYLVNKNKIGYNFIAGENINGEYFGVIESNKPFKIKDDDIFLSGDNFSFSTKENCFFIKKKAHIIYTKIPNKEVYDIKSNEMKVFGNDNFAILNEDIKFLYNDNVLTSQFAKIYFDADKRPTNIFISNNVKIVHNGNEAKSDFGYFDIQNNLLLLYSNVNIISKTNASSGEFYIYNLLDKSVVSFTENTILPKNQQDNIYKILEKISEELNLQQKLYIVNFVKNNKIYNNANALHNYGVNYNIDRQKRTKIEVVY